MNEYEALVELFGQI